MPDIALEIVEAAPVVLNFAHGGALIYGPYYDIDAAIADGLTTGQSFSLTYPNGYDLPEGIVIKIP